MKDQKTNRSDARQFIQSRAEYMDLREIRTERNIKEQRVYQVADYTPLHPSTRSWEVPRDRVSVEKIIGKGAFGQVAKGTAEKLRGRPGRTTVAIKMLKSMIFHIVISYRTASYTLDALAIPMHCSCAAVKLHVTTRIFMY